MALATREKIKGIGYCFGVPLKTCINFFFWLNLDVFAYHYLLQGSNDESKSVEITRLQKLVQSLGLELDAAKLATVNECNKNAVLKSQLDMSVNEKSSLERELVGMADLRNENSYLKVSKTYYKFHNVTTCV